MLKSRRYLLSSSSRPSAAQSFDRCMFRGSTFCLIFSHFEPTRNHVLLALSLCYDFSNRCHKCRKIEFFLVIWLTNGVFWVTKRVFWIIYIECFKSCGVDLFHVLRFLQTYSMFSHPGWQDSTVCGNLVTAPFVIAIVIICVLSECGPQGMTWNL